MYRKTISVWLLATTLLFASCQDMVVIDNDNISTLKFSIDNTHTTTRGSIVESSTDVENFGVIASYDTNNTPFSPDFMDNVLVSKTSNNKWSYSPIKYWTNNNSLSFFGYSPYGNEQNGIDLDYSNNGISLNYTVPTNVTLQPDLMVCSPQIGLTNSNSSIKLAMRHVLTAIGFTVNGSGEQVTKIGFKNIYTSGKLDITNDSPTWSYTTNSSTIYYAGLPAGGVEASNSGNLAINSNGYLMMLPQKLPDRAQLVAEVDGEVRTLDIDGTEWIMGEKKIYDIGLSSVWMLADFSATSYPSDDYWIIGDTYSTALSHKEYKGLCEALDAISNTNREITIEFKNLSTLTNNIIYYNSSNNVSALKKLLLPVATNISARALYNCDGIEKIEMPNATKIDFEAFKYCENLKEVYAPLVKEIQYDAFAQNDSIINIDFPVVKSIGANCFESCSGLETVNLPLAKDIYTGAFKNCDALKSIYLPSAMTIHPYAFSSCDILESVSLPVAKTINAYAFKFCYLLKDVNLPLVTEVKAEAFSYCKFLTSINLPIVSVLGSNAFEYCYAITKVNFPQLKEIGNDAFKSCKLLANIRLVSAKSIGNSAFKSCNSLSTIELSTANNAVLEDIGRYVFDYSNSEDAILTIGNTSSSITVNVTCNTLTSGSSTYTFNKIIQQ